jgi:hypothetical protein
MRAARSKNWQLTLLLSLVLGIAPLASAADFAVPGAEFPLQVHGFVSQGAFKTTDNNYLGYSEQGSFAFTEVGLNFTQQVSDKLRVGLQVFARDLGPLGNYQPRFDWYYVDYRFRDWLGVRAGHTRIPFGLFNDSSEVDAARVPILLPQSVYPADHLEYLLSQTGFELYGDVEAGPAGSFEYRAYGGTLDLDQPKAPAGATLTGFAVPYVVGGRLMWTTPLDGLTAGASYQTVRLDGTYHLDPALEQLLVAAGLLPPGLGGTLPTVYRVYLSVASLSYRTGNLELSAEYSRWIGNFASAAPKLFPPHTVNERYYAMASYRVLPWLTPGAYYSAFFPNVDERSEQKDYQRDAALFVRFDLTRHWLVKLEGHYLSGTAALDPALHGQKDLNDLPGQWGLLMLKTTAYF